MNFFRFVAVTGAGAAVRARAYATKVRRPATLLTTQHSPICLFLTWPAVVCMWGPAVVRRWGDPAVARRWGGPAVARRWGGPAPPGRCPAVLVRCCEGSAVSRSRRGSPLCSTCSAPGSCHSHQLPPPESFNCHCSSSQLNDKKRENVDIWTDFDL